MTSKGTEKFTYDPAGNRKTGPGPKDTGYAYNDANQMTAGRNLAYTYDNVGNQADRIIPGVTDKSWSQYWDYENRLVKVEKIKGAERRTVSFKYDPFGRRVEKKLETVIRGVTKSITWTYLYDDEDIALEILDNSTITTRTYYTHGPGIDEPLALERNGQFYFYHADHLGSIVAITDSARNVVQSYQYDSFGMVKATTGFINSYTFQGREWDPQTGLYYYRARYYDPLAGRFISKDPIGFRGGDINLYGFAVANPVNYTDPMGLDATIPWTWGWGGAAEGAGAGAAAGTGAMATTCGALGSAALIVAGTSTSTSTYADYPPKDECMPKGKWICEGNAQYEIIGENKHVIRGQWIIAYGNTEAEAAHAWKKAVQASAPRGHTARHIRPRCYKIR